METREEEHKERGGTGGKLTRRSFQRRAPLTPYDLPPGARAAGRRGGGWLPKVLSRSASVILPSLFSSPFSSRQQDLPLAPETGREDSDRFATCIENDQLVEPNKPSFTEACFPIADAFLRDKMRDAYHGGRHAEIEDWLKLRTFSKQESHCLMELLRSRTSEPLDGTGCAVGFISEAAEDNKSPRKSPISVSVSEQRSIPKASNSFCANAHELGSSPVDIAKAYMEALTTGSYYETHDGRFKPEKSSTVYIASHSGLSYPSAFKSQIGYIDALVHNNNGYLTPQAYRGRVGSYKYLGTPYSGIIFSKSKIMKGIPNVASIPGSPVSQVHQKIKRTTPVRETGSANIATFSSPSSATPDAFKSFSSIFRGSLDKDVSKSGVQNFKTAGENKVGSTYAVDSSSVHPQSSEIAQKILNHLERTVPPPKERPLRLKPELGRIKVSAKSVNPAKDDLKRANTTVCNDLNTDRRDYNGIRDSVATDKVTSVPYTSRSHNEDHSLSFPQSTKGSIKPLDTTMASSDVSQPPAFLCSSGNTTKSCEKNYGNGFNFTLPVPQALYSFSVPPPTPTMILSPLLMEMPSNIPSFSFGLTGVKSDLVFSFGSIASSNFISSTFPKFSFGSDKKCSLSFRSFG